MTASVDRDGTFRTDDAPSGDFVLSVRFSKMVSGALADYRFTVPPVEEIASQAGKPIHLYKVFGASLDKSKRLANYSSKFCRDVLPRVLPRCFAAMATPTSRPASQS